MGFPVGKEKAGKLSTGKESPMTRETWVQSLGWEDPLAGKGYPLQYYNLENPMNCIVHGVTKSQTQLSQSLIDTKLLLSI